MTAYEEYNSAITNIARKANVRNATDCAELVDELMAEVELDTTLTQDEKWLLSDRHQKAIDWCWEASSIL